MLTSLRRSGAKQAPASPVPFHAPLFYDVAAPPSVDKRRIVLDLGAASTAMLALLGQSRCRVDIADLAHFGGVDRLNAVEMQNGQAKAGTLLPSRGSSDPVDLIFCWDLPNHLSLNALSALMTAIRERARPGAIAHALIAYADREMQERPGCYVPTPEGELVDLNVPGSTVAAPRYSPEDLGLHMGGFVIDRARLLSNGMQEFLFRLDATDQ